MEKQFNEKEWKGESNSILKKRKSKLRIINVYFFAITIIIFLALLIASILYLGLEGYFSPTLVDNSTCIMPDIPPCPECPDCTCSCPPPKLSLSFDIESLKEYLLNDSIDSNESG